MNPLPQLEAPQITPDSLRFFQSIQECFQLACSRKGLVVRTYQIADRSIQLQFAGEAPVSLMTQALAHLPEAPCAKPDLTLCVWDSASTGVELPPRPWALEDYMRLGEIRGFNDERFYTMYQHDDIAIHVLDAATNLGTVWIRDASRVPDVAMCWPLRPIFHWWVTRSHQAVVHAAAVGRPGGGMVIAGGRGAGKSTTALACLHSKLRVAGDDQIFLSSEPAPHAYSLYNSVKIHLRDLERFPRLANGRTIRIHSTRQKALLFLHESAPGQMVTGFPIKALALSTITPHADTRIRKASPAAVLAAFAPSTMFQLPRLGTTPFQMMAELVRQLPCYSLELGSDLSQIPEVISDLLD